MTEQKGKPDTSMAPEAKAEAKAGNGATPDHVVETKAEAEARELRRVFTMKQLLPDDTYIKREIALKPKGFKLWIGSVTGMIVGATRKMNTMKNGDVRPSTVFEGIFECTSFLTGEITIAKQVYLPEFYAAEIGKAFEGEGAHDARKLNVDIGLESTGRDIAHAWTVRAYLEGDDMSVLKELRRRERPKDAAKQLPPPEAAKAS